MRNHVYRCVCLCLWVRVCLCDMSCVLHHLFCYSLLPKCVLISINSSFLQCFVFKTGFDIYYCKRFCLCLHLVFVICTTAGVNCFSLQRNKHFIFYKIYQATFFIEGVPFLRSDSPPLSTQCRRFKVIDDAVRSTVLSSRD